PYSDSINSEFALSETVAFLQPLQSVAGLVVMFGLEMRADHGNGGDKYRHVIGEADAQKKIRNGIDGQHEIGQRTQKNALHLERRGAVESAVIGCNRVLGKRNGGKDTGHLGPEARTYFLLVAGQDHGKMTPSLSKSGNDVGSLSGFFKPFPHSYEPRPVRHAHGAAESSPTAYRGLQQQPASHIRSGD